jgi:hypothetical protein
VQKLCATGELQELDGAFYAGGGLQHVAVYVYPTDFTLREPMCPGTGTRGTLTLTF